MPWILLTLIVIVASISRAAADSTNSDVMRSYTRARAVLDAGVAAMGGADALMAVGSVAREFEGTRINSPGASMPGPDAAQIVPQLNALGWKVQRMQPTHGFPASVEELNRSLQVRAKYVKGADTRYRLQ
jgi:hypothetical protein